MFNKLKEINSRPKPFEIYTADELWTNEYTAKQMLEYHLNEDIDLSSRNPRFIDRSVEWLVSLIGGGDGAEVADFGCGPGLYAKRLAECGAKVTGIDFSSNSLKYAREIAEREKLSIDYVHENYLDFETPKSFDLVMMIMCDFCALSPKQRKIMLNKFYSILKPGGSVVLDVHSLNFFNQREEAAIYELNQLNGFWSPDDYYCFVNTFKYEDDKVTLDKYTIIEPMLTRTVYNWLQCYSKESLRTEFMSNGFEVEGIYSDVAGTVFDPKSPEMAIVARK
ncbi:MAG: class I SAM-dependent methyltransferase [Desulfobulbaceae bacterium]|nr:class I SAM-dependent methyltransferase [Desulfobulbaceae bacterium]